MNDFSIFQWSSASRTHVGKVRKHNEDAYVELPEHRLWAVADGMGGHAVGDVASNMVADALKQLTIPDTLDEHIDQVKACLQNVNQQLINEAVQRRESLIGSTVAVFIAHKDRCACIWAGDSRIYLSRDGRLSQLSRDHSQLEELIAQGLLTRDQATDFSGGNAITRAIGAADTLELDTEIHEIRDGDIYLLCSDGLTNEVSEDEIATELARGNCERICDTLMQYALQRRARDNITIVVASAINPLEPTETIINPITHGNKSPI